jgi:hypothetical protein
MLVGVVALNALSVSRRMREGGGSIGSTSGRASRRFSGVETSSRAGLMRVGTQSSVPGTDADRSRGIRVGGVLV